MVLLSYDSFLNVLLLRYDPLTSINRVKVKQMNFPFSSSHVQLWDTERPDGIISLVHSSSMLHFNWAYTQFSQFNADDSLLLVSGVYLGPHQSSSGEIAVISLGGTCARASQ